MTLRPGFDLATAERLTGPPLQQSEIFVRAMRRLGQTANVHDMHVNGTVMGRAIVITRRMPIVGAVKAVLRGPMWEPHATDYGKSICLADLRRTGVHLIEAEQPYPALAAAGYRQVFSAATVALLDLGDTREDWAAGLSPKWRASLRQSQSNDLRLSTEAFAGEAAEWLLTAEQDLRQTRAYRSANHLIAQGIAATEPVALSLEIARHRREIIAAMLFVRHGTAATYLLGATSDQGRASRAHHALLDRAADRLRADGVRTIDLGTINTNRAPGLARFKLGTGAKPTPLGGSWIGLPFY